MQLRLETIKDSLKAAYEASLARENELKTRVEVLKSDLLDLQKRSIQYNILKREVDTNRELYTSLLQRYKEVDVASGAGSNNVFVVDRAQPGAPSSTSLFSALLKALALGLGLGVAAAYGLEKLDDKIRSAEQVEEITGLSALGVIPKVAKVEEELADPRSALAKPTAPFARRCSSRRRMACPRAWRSRAPDRGRVSRSPHWPSRSISPLWAAKFCWLTRISAIPRCMSNSVVTIRLG